MILGTALFLLAGAGLVTTKARPNIILIFADDLGYGDLGCYGSNLPTPEIDRLAREGFRSTDCLVAANVCGPSRAALLTGRYPMRAGHPISRHDFPKYAQYGIAPEELTIAELLKSAGYYTKLIGKWHLGFHVEGSHPLDAGFDAFLGLRANHAKNMGDADTLYRDREILEEGVSYTVVTKRYTEEAVGFIEAAASTHSRPVNTEPFFLYFSHHIPHTPIEASEPFVGASGKKGVDGEYGDVVLELDHSVGRVLAAVDKAGIADNTLIVFLSDNGPARFGSAGPLIGGKYVTTEGGHRVPGIFRWPGRIPAGQVSDAMITSMDLLPLFSRVAGVELPDDRVFDGKDIFELLIGQATQSPHEYFHYYNGLNLQAVRNETWKLHFPRSVDDQPYWAKRKAGKKVLTTLDEHLLFNLDTDVGESVNVLSQHLEVVAELKKEAARIRVEIGDVHVVGTDQRPHGLVNPNEKE